MSDLPDTDPQHWRRRAEETKRYADEASNPEEKAVLLEIIRLYERLIERLESSRD